MTSSEVRVRGHQQRYAEFTKTPPHDLINPTELREVNLRIVRDLPSRRSRNEIHWGEGAQTRGTWISTGDHVAEWLGIKSALVDLIAPTAKRQLFAMKFDPEALGFFGAEDFQGDETADPLGLSFDLFTSQLALVSLRSLGGGRFEAYLQENTKGALFPRDQFVIIDENRGFAIEGRKYRKTASDGTAVYPFDGEISVDWSKKGDLWLPSRLRETRRSGLSTFDLAFDWISVNAPVRDGEFELDSIGASPGTTIVDDRLGPDKSIILGKIGGAVSVPEVKLPAPFLRPSTIALLAVGGCLLVLALYGLLIAWRRAGIIAKEGQARS